MTDLPITTPGMTTKSKYAPDSIFTSCESERQNSETAATEAITTRQSAATGCSAIVGHWTPVTEKMPGDKITVLVWVGSMGNSTLAYHDSEVLSRRGDSGWIMAGTATSKRVLLNVTHWCAEIHPPNTEDRASEEH